MSLKLHCILLAAACFFFSCSKQSKEANFTTLFLKRDTITSNKVWMPYRILYPKNYTRTKKYPLVLFLHGGGERGGDNEKQLTHGLSLFVTEANREKFPCIVIVPQCPDEGYWASAKIDRSVSPYAIHFNYSRPLTPSLTAAIEILDHTIHVESVDKNRIYIIGLSMGGLGTLEAVHKYPEKFAAAVPICGGGDTLRYDVKENEISFWLFHGEKDNLIDVNNSRAMVRKLKSLDLPVKYTEFPAVKHDSWDNAFTEPELLPWLFLQKK